MALILSAEGGFFFSCIHSMTDSSNLGKSSDQYDFDAQLPQMGQEFLPLGTISKINGAWPLTISILRSQHGVGQQIRKVIDRRRRKSHVFHSKHGTVFPLDHRSRPRFFAFGRESGSRKKSASNSASVCGKARMSRLMKGDDIAEFQFVATSPTSAAIPFRTTPDSSDRHHACHLRLTSHASAWAMVLLSLGLIVYAPHCSS